MEATKIPPPPPPLPPKPSTRDALFDLLAEEDEEFKVKRYQKNLQFRMVGAIEKEDVTLLKELINDGVNTNASILLVKTPLTHVLDSVPISKANLELLLGANTQTDPNLGESTEWGMRPIHFIARHGSVELADFFLKCPRGSLCDIDIKDNGGCTALHFAIYHGHAEMIKYLIDKGADVFAVDGCGKTTFHRACERHNYELAEYLLDKGLSVDPKSKYGWTPLFHSVFFHDMQMTKFLISKGANLQLKDKFGESLIQVACYLQWVVDMCRYKHYPVKATTGSSFNYYERTRGIPTDGLNHLLISHGERMFDIVNFTEHLNMVKLLVNTGTDPNTYRSDWVAETGGYDSLAKTRAFLLLAGSFLSPDDPWVTKDNKWRTWFTEQLTEQYSLQRQCRRSIRLTVARTRDIDSAIETLPIPLALKMYLKLGDFDILMNSIALID